ncbi:saccharopine dehydrogenase NADP-binding domain-containing protein [Nocardia sp. NPDC058176]|uniref:saccharopine dehydrogenase NADP-binding domain-containing protein n=1 Tax=Nocardia sp. NPDC058176 TaxID=3346368 RepID=UPI0036DE2B9C
MTGRVVLLGATGYTGGLVLDSLRHRGIEPVLAGRNRDSLRAIADRHGGLDHALVDVTDPVGVATLVRRGDILISTVGPFERFGHAVAAAAADVGAHYIDTTGEVGFVLELRRRLHDRARETGSLMLPAFGYDYVPGILAGTLAAHEAGAAARAVDIGYFASGPLWRGLSQGTRTTMRDGLTLPAPRWRDHHLTEERTAAEVRKFTVREHRKNAFLVSGTEVLFLPAEFPLLDAVSVYNGWFPALSRPITVAAAAAAVTSRFAIGRKLVDRVTRPMIGPAGGPDADRRARIGSHVTAVAYSGPDVLSEVQVRGPNSYTLTGELIAWAAQQLTTSAPRAAGVVSPVEAFGFATLRDGCAEIGLAPI